MLCLCCGLAQAEPLTEKTLQRPPAVRSPLLISEQMPDGGEVLIERLQLRDGGSQVDELRVGGETRSITVTPAGGALPYQLVPAAGANSSASARDSSAPASQRVWNVLSF
jgi:hypothetical protein